MTKRLWNRDFILLLQGSAVSTIGDLMYSVAIGYWVYERTGSSALMGIMSSISMFVTMFLSPFAGSIVDKISRKWVLVIIDALQGLIMLAVGALAYWDKLTVPGVLIAALLAAFGSVFYSPAVSTLMIDIIPQQEMVRGRSLYSGVHSVINLVGSAFSGAMVALFGVPLIVVINGLSNLYSAGSELFVSVPRTAQQGMPVTVKSVVRDSAEAVRIIFSNRFLRLFVPCALALNLLGAGPLTLILPFCMEKGFSVAQYGYLMSVWTGASLVCVLLLGIVRFKASTRFWMLALGFTCSIPFLVLAYLSHQFIPTCIFAFLGAFLNCAGNSVFNAALMLALPEENRGSILGFISSASVGGTALSAVIYGFLGDLIPMPWLFAAGGLLSLPLMLYMCFTPRTRAFILEH